jgi:L-seryl-tRNA(Ser) seleniumtransferase
MTDAVAAVAKRAGATFVDVQPLAGLTNPGTYGFQSTDTIRERLDAGADLVIADGAGLIGGPACGVIVGRRALVTAAAGHHLSTLTMIEAPTAAALQATLQEYRDDEQGRAAFSIPVWQLLSAPAANLKQRSERLAELIAASPTVASAAAREVQSAWLQSGTPFLAPTWVVEVRPKTGEAAGLQKLLHQGAYPIAARVEEGAVHLDLRSVFPRWDQQLVAAFEGPHE